MTRLTRRGWFGLIGAGVAAVSASRVQVAAPSPSAVPVPTPHRDWNALWTILDRDGRILLNQKPVQLHAGKTTHMTHRFDQVIGQPQAVWCRLTFLTLPGKEITSPVTVVPDLGPNDTLTVQWLVEVV